MRKKVLNGKRVMALALALSLTVGEAGVAVAAPVNAGDVDTVAVEEVTQPEEAAQPAAEQTVSANEGDVQETPEAEEQPAEEAAEATDDIEAEEKVDGTLSKVIGVEASTLDYEKINDENGNTVLRYQTRDTSGTKFEAPGKVEQQENAPWLFSYNGKLYNWGTYNSAKNTTTFYTGNEMTAVAGQPENFWDANTGLYVVNGAYYTYLPSDSANVYYNVNNQVIPATAISITGSEYSSEYGYEVEREVRKSVNQVYGVYASNATPDYTYNSPNYYDLNGRKFSYFSAYNDQYTVTSQTTDATGNKVYTVVPYFYYSNEMLVDTAYVGFDWNTLNIPEGLKNAAGQELYLGYEVEVNGALYNKYFNAYDAAGATHELVIENNEDNKMIFQYDELLTNGQTVTVRARGVYYHKENKVGAEADGTPVGTDVNVIDTVGEWSEPVSYTYTAPQAVAAVPAVSAAFIKGETTISGTSSDTKDIIRGSFTGVANASGYRVYRIASKKAIGLTAANFKAVYNWDDTTLQQLGISYGDISTWNTYSQNGTFEETGLEAGYSYYYYAVVPSGVADSVHFVNAQTIGTIAAIAAVTVPEASTALPQVTNLRVEKYANGGKALVWDKTDKDVAIFAYEAAAFPAYYTAKLQNPRRTETVTDEDGNTTTGTYSLLYADLSEDEKLALKKVQCENADGTDGKLDLSNFTMTPGRTYYFVAYTYDDNNRNSNQTPYVYNGTKETEKNGVKTKTPVSYNYYEYTPISAASAVVAVKEEMDAKPVVSTFVTKNSVKLTISGTYGTGYEIYRKSGKKFKKIATTNSDVYTDEGLKANTTYTYKVRSYYYNRDTQEKYYSDYRILTVKTADAANIDVVVTKASKTAVKVSWTKVSNATKYEIYRSNSENADPKVLSKKYSASGIKKALNNQRFELVKTLSKSKKSYTDKKLTAGETYTYVVIAYYKAGNKTECVTDSDYAYLGLDNGVYRINGVISGSKAKITWEKDKYASKYEVEYTVYDVYGNPKTSQPAKATTKKAGYTVSGLAAGENVSLRVRAVGKGNVYSDWSEETVVKNLAPVKGIKAVATSKKNAAGQTVKGVKITWKAVAGAKYYKVYRSTVEGDYDKDAKTYDAGGTVIVKEANDNFSVNSASLKLSGYRSSAAVYYKEYREIEDSIAGTTAYDYADFPSGVTYYYTVVAYGEAPVDGTDSPVYSTQVAKAAKITVNGIDTVTVKNAKKGKVTVTFNAVKGATKYTVYRTTKKNGKYEKAGTVKVTKKNKNKATLSYTGKAAKKTYYYKVVAEGTNGLKADLNAESPVKKIKVKK